MRTTALLACPGAVVVHRDQAVSCTDDTCPRDLPRGTWFSLHSSFVQCRTSFDIDDCPDCGFETRVNVEAGGMQPNFECDPASHRRGRFLESALHRRASS